MFVVAEATGLRTNDDSVPSKDLSRPFDEPVRVQMTRPSQDVIIICPNSWYIDVLPIVEMITQPWKALFVIPDLPALAGLKALGNVFWHRDH